MMTRSVVRALVLAAFCGAAATQSASAQTQQGTITGRVTDVANNQPIASAQINVVGTTVGTQTNAEGQFTLRGVNAGSVEVRVLRVGYGEVKQSVTVTAGSTVTANFTMRAIPTTLAPVVTTATGEQRRVEVGNAIAQVDAKDVVAKQSVTNVGDLLTSRAPGVSVFGGTQTGAGTRIRVRGTSSLSLSNNPIYIIDGVRVEGTTGSSTLSVGGTTPARIGDINPEEIENVEIVRGPSASTLYGTDAANGVIVITTKRGLAGRPQWNYYTEQTALRDQNDYPTAFWGWRTGPNAATTSTRSNTVQCFLTQVAAGTCVQDSVTSYNLHKDKESTPYGTGYRQQHGLQLRGGSEAIRYFASGEWEDEDGVTKVPEFEKRYMPAHARSLLPGQQSPNHLNRKTARTNLNMTLPNNMDLAINAGYTSQDLRLPMSDDSGTSGIAANVYGGPGFKYNLTAAGDTLYGWRQFTPRDVYQAVSNQAIERLITSASSNWRPKEWLAVRGNLGVDYINRTDTQLCRFANCPDVGTDRQGYKRDNRSNFFIYTLDAAGTATRRLAETIESKTTAGVQYYRNVFDRNGVTGSILVPGAVTATGAANKTADEATTESRTLGGFVEENIAWRDRLFVTGAVRSDRNSAFGRNFKTVFYPKVSASWIVSDEAFARTPAFVNQIRLRSAYGASGVQPGTTDAVPFYTATTGRQESGDAPALVFTTAGNANLKPERSTEFEAGIDGTFWDNRISTEITYYNKSSKDALVSRVIPPSIGIGNTTRFENLGEIRNSGWEALANATIINKPVFGWDITVNGSRNTNKIVRLGVPPIITSSTLRQIEGYPLNGWWVRGVLKGWQDKNGDGIITYNANDALSEIVVDTTPTFLGYSTPRNELAVTNGFDFLRHRLRLSGMIDYKGGYKTYNNTERIRCASRNNCEGLISPNASLFEQARTVMVREHPTRSVGGFIEDGDFIRFREISLSYTASGDFAARYLRGHSLVASAAVRNVGILWTKYTGVDPEAFGTTGDSPSEFQAFGPPTYFAFRVNLGF
jgi:TonB-linked SusC/RagA family outer membrane protein